MVRDARIRSVVFDLEFTAWDDSLARGWDGANEHKELVQIGAVKLDARSCKEIDAFEMLVQPRINPVLSNYLAALTGVTNEALKIRGVDFSVAYRAFLDFVGDATIWAFGRDDAIFIDNMKLYGLRMKTPPYRNVIPWMAAQGIDLTGKHACDVAEAAGAKFEGRAHDALADARSVALGMTTLIERGAENPFLSGLK